MTKRDKLLERVRNNPRNVTMRDRQTLLESFGFVLDRTSGSHYIFIGAVAGEGVALVIPLHKPHVKAGYVKDVLAVIDQLQETRNEEVDN